MRPSFFFSLPLCETSSFSLPPEFPRWALHTQFVEQLQMPLRVLFFFLIVFSVADFSFVGPRFRELFLFRMGFSFSGFQKRDSISSRPLFPPFRDRNQRAPPPVISAFFSSTPSPENAFPTPFTNGTMFSHSRIPQPRPQSPAQSLF